MERPGDDRKDRGEEPEPGGRAAERRRQFERSRGLPEGERELELPDEGAEEEPEHPEEEQP